MNLIANENEQLLRTYRIWFVATALLLVSAIPFCGICASEGNWTGTVNATIGPDSPHSPSLYAHKSDFVTVTVSGSIKLGEGAPWSGPEGTTYYGWAPLPHGYSHGILMLMIDGRHLPIEGGARSLEAPCEGPISVYVNDDVSEDNLGSFEVSVTVGPGVVGDADQDGLDDRLEDALLDAWVPEFRFDSDENIRPADVYWFLRGSALVNRNTFDTLLDFHQVPFHSEWFLERVTSQGQPTNYLDFPNKSGCAATEGYFQRHGPTWDRVTSSRNLGIYGHVVPTSQQNTEIVIEYWIFFPGNNTGTAFGLGDHSGDWEFYKVFLFNSGVQSNLFDTASMLRAEWHGHGEWPALVVWDRNASPKWWRWVGEKTWVTITGSYPTMPSHHPPIYIEAGTHGLLPAEGEYCNDNYPIVTWCSDCDGDSYTFTPTSVPNLGEPYRPRLGMEVITHFNGFWGGGGDSPEGPVVKGGRWQTNHNAGDYPDANVEVQYVGQWDLALMPSSTRGRISRPWQSVSEAVDASPAGRSIMIYPGNYTETIRITKPMTLRAPHGGVRIGY